MGSTVNFFERKKPWSIIKDKLLSAYLVPYISKISKNKKIIIFIDCFAGKGKFDDGSLGSPLIVMNALTNAKIDQYFVYYIEKKYSKELQQNLEKYDSHKYEIIDGAYEENIENILQKCSNCNVFMYVDPYGIKNLDFSFFELLNQVNCNSKEMLINFNTGGLIRMIQAKYKFQGNINNDPIEDFEEENETNVIDKLYGSPNWKGLIENYKESKNYVKCERALSKEYEENLRRIFKYVLNIPIMNKNVIKYRLYFGTNNDDGFILMANNMNRRWRELNKKNENGQMSLFNLASPSGEIFDEDEIKKMILEIIQKNINIELKELLIIMFDKFGILYNESEYCKILRVLEKEDKIIINREPEYTPKRKKSIFISWRYDPKLKKKRKCILRKK